MLPLFLRRQNTKQALSERTFMRLWRAHRVSSSTRLLKYVKKSIIIYKAPTSVFKCSTKPREQNRRKIWRKSYMEWLASIMRSFFYKFTLACSTFEEEWNRSQWTLQTSRPRTETGDDLSTHQSTPSFLDDKMEQSEQKKDNSINSALHQQ